jgi:phosphatidyl-myo-inositol alpha-mannosyltransferase
MKIVISNYDDINNPDYAGGGAVVIDRLIKYLSAKYEVTLITGKYPGSKNETVDGIKYKRIGSYIFGGKFGHLFYSIALPLECIKEKCNLWIDSFTPPFSVSLLPLILGKNKVIGLVHMLSGKDMKRKYHLPFDVVEKWGLRLYRNFIVLTEFTKNEILNANPRAEVSVIPNGIDIPNGSQLKVKKNNQMLFIGRIEVDQKGLDLLLKAFKKVSGKSDWSLIIAGKGIYNEMNKLKDLIETFGLIDRVKLVGRVGGKLKTQIIRESSIIIIPSRYETLSMTALEALANKTALITFDIDGFKWIPDEIAVKIPKWNTDLLADKMLKMTKDFKKRNTYTDLGYKFALQYSWKRIFSMYEKTIANNIR